MLRGRVVAQMLPSLCYASGEGLTQPLTLISRLVLASPSFAQQYLQAKGLEAPILNRYSTMSLGTEFGYLNRKGTSNGQHGVDL